MVSAIFIDFQLFYFLIRIIPNFIKFKLNQDFAGILFTNHWNVENNSLFG